MKKLRPNQKYWALLEVQTDGKFKIKKANKHVAVNQHKRGRHWEVINARDLARTLMSNKLVTR